MKMSGSQYKGITSGSRSRLKMCGQASVEYTIVLMLVVIVLISYDDGSGVVHSAVGDVVKALKDLFGAYSWAISFSNNLTPL